MTGTVFKRRESETLSETVIRSVAAMTCRRPQQLQPLYEEIDPDALDNIFTRSGNSGIQTLTMLYEGCRIQITQDSIKVEEVPMR